MKPQAVLYLLWDKNIDVLRAHVNRVHGTTVLYYSPLPQTSPALLQAVAPMRCLDIATLYDTNRQQSAQAQLATAQAAAASLPQAATWVEYCDRNGVDATTLAAAVTAVGEQHWPAATHLLQCLDAALERFDLRVVLLNDDVTSAGRLIAEWARRTGVKSVLVQHSILLGTAYTVHGGLHADVTAVFGTRGMDAYLDIGISPERLVATGNPAWDIYRTLPAQRHTVRAQMMPRHGLDPSRPLVVFGTTWAANLTAHCNAEAYAESLGAFLGAFRQLRDRYPQLQALVKDRVSNESLFRKQFEAILPTLGLPTDSVAYATSDTESWVVAADVVVAVDSNLIVEAILAGTPAVNLANLTGFMIGPAFDAESGVVEVESTALAPAIDRLLGVADWRGACIEAGRHSRSHYQDAAPETAAVRVAQLLENVGQFHSSTPGYVWQEYLDVEEIEATGYHGGARGDLVDMFTNNPRAVLDIGCAAGGTGELLKHKYPHCKVWGVETNRSAARVAAQRLDRVLVGMFESFNLEQEGLAKGTLDGVILADVLEHMYNPWSVMMALHPYLSTTAQVIISIPNVRNLKLMEDLAGGYWRYEPAGLLDITHIRFFTLKEFRRFLHETGYHVNTLRYGIDQRLLPFFSATKDLEKQNIELGRMRLADVGREELHELCSLQFYINASLGAMPEDIRSYHVSAPYTEQLQRSRLTRAQASLYDQLIAQWPTPPRVLMLVAVAEGQDDGLTATVKNLRGQLYQQLSICVVSAAAAPAGVPLGDRFQWLTSSGGISDALNSVASSSGHDWVGWLNAGDLLEPQALLRVVEAVQRKPDWRFVYGDEDTILSENEFGDPVYKPDFDPQFLLSMPYLGGFCLVRRESLQALGGSMPELAGAEQVDLALRVWQRWGTKAVGHVDGVLYHRSRVGGRSLAEHVQAAQQAVNHALRRTGLPVAAEPGWRPGVFRWQWRGTTDDLVSILIPVRDDLPKLQRTLESLLAHTRHEAFEILLLDNGSIDPGMLAFLQGLDALGDPRLKVYRYLDRVGMPRLYNLLAAEAKGHYLALMHFDCTPLDPQWLDALIGEAQRPGVGLIAPRLLDGQGKVRGGGVILGIDGGYAPAFAGLAHDDPGPWGRAHAAQAFSAVTGGLWLIQREVFNALGGLDQDMGLATEVDFCLRLKEAGYQALWTPYISMLSDGAAWAVDWLGNGEPASGDKVSMDAPARAIEPLLDRWLREMTPDPAYNRSLTTTGVPFSVEQRAVLLDTVLPWKPLPRILVHPADTTGCGHYRILQPAKALAAANVAETLIGHHILQATDLARLDVDTVVFQRQLYEPQVRRMRQARRHYKPFMVFELDDLITNVPSKNLHRSEIPGDTGRWLREACGLCDRFVVSTAPLAEAMKGYNDDIRVVPNVIDASIWGALQIARKDEGRPRVGWAGGVSHTGDLDLIADVVKELADDVDWVFLGMCPDTLRPYVAEFYPGVPIDKYPSTLAGLGLDLAVAPLEINPFNEAKSNLKLLEYGALGYAVICTDIVPYQCNLPVTRVKNRYRDWVAAIREQLADRAELHRRGQALKQAVLNEWTMDSHLDTWLKGWTR